MFNYCGPYWSDGKFQSSVDGSVPATNGLDLCCRQHDADYYNATDSSSLTRADSKFGACASQQGLLGKAFGYAVQKGGVLFHPILPGRAGENMVKKNLRGPKSQAVSQKKFQRPPTSYSEPMVPKVMRQKRVKDGVIVDCTYMLGKAVAPSQGNTEMIGVFYLNPWMTGNGELQSLSQCYEEFRITALSIGFRGFQPTSTGGEVIIIAEENANTVLPAVNTGTFYTKAFTGVNTLVTPVWNPADMAVKIDSRWKTVDSFNVVDLNDAVSGAIYIIVDGNTNNSGYYLADMKVEFRGLKYNPHPLNIGSFIGGFNSQTLVCSSATPTAGGAVQLSGSGFTIGDIYRVVLNPVASGFTLPTNTTLANWLRTGAGSTFTLSTSSVFYACATSTSLIYLYTSYASAVSSDGASGTAAEYNTTGATAGSLTRSLITNVNARSQPTS